MVKVSVILPVYNVESYLRQCLDSVVNQTLRFIQIICVNDGSTDHSLDILRDYADRDARIEIIDQENQGGGSARNAAYPYIKGTYSYFADPDDWLELDLCEKTSQKLDATGADVVHFQHFWEYPNGNSTHSHPFDPNLPDVSVTSEHRAKFLVRRAPWRRCWRSEFLLKHQIRFSEGKRPYNDIFHTWKGCILAERLALLHDLLYHHRHLRPGSYQNTVDRKHFALVSTMNDIGAFLNEAGKYDQYRNIFLSEKLRSWYYLYRKLPAALKPEYMELLWESLSDDDREFCRTAKHLPNMVQLFYAMLDGGSTDILKFHIANTLKQVIQAPEQLFRNWIVKPMKNRRKAA